MLDPDPRAASAGSNQRQPDVRDVIDYAEGIGELARIDGADWNLEIYRVVAHDRNSAGVWMSPGKHGRLIRDKYFARGQPCPVVICCGQDPVLFLAGSHEIKHGVSEFAYAGYAGGHRGRAYETVASELHGLPMPSHAEIVLEGEFLPDETRPEGPFGEFTGYYASHVREEPVVRIRRVYHRHDPILTMASPMRPPTDVSFAKCIVQSGMIWDEIETAGLSRRQGRVVPRGRRHPHVHRRRHRADASGPRPAGRIPGRQLPFRQLRRTLGDRGRRGHRSDRSRRRGLGDVDALRSGRRHRLHQARLVDAARPDAARAAVGEQPRHRQCLPAVAVAARISRGGVGEPGVAQRRRAQMGTRDPGRDQGPVSVLRASASDRGALATPRRGRSSMIAPRREHGP